MTEPARIIFLDVDGVVLATRHWAAGWRPNQKLPADSIVRLNTINQLAAPVGWVISSTWRLDRNFPFYLRASGFEGHLHLDWRTPYVGGQSPSTSVLAKRRGQEIADWMAAHPEIDYADVVILDDDSDFLCAQRPRHIQTTHAEGLTDADVDQALALLGVNASVSLVGAG